MVMYVLDLWICCVCVTEADPNYVPVHDEEISHTPVKGQVQSKFDKAHNSMFGKYVSTADQCRSMKMISIC